MLGLADQLVKWFWDYGVQRLGSHAIGADWLDEAYECRRRLAVAQAAGNSAKPVAAVWGPSQSGKSTLISSLVDDPDGGDSALNWTAQQPACFGGLNFKPGVLKLNPHNLGSDASGCVTRFVMRRKEDLFDPQHPVRVEFGSSQQIKHALAAGFLTEANTAGPDGAPIRFDESSIVGMLGETGLARRPDQELFETLHDFTYVLEQLIATGHPRFESLGANDRWAKATRRTVLGSSRLGSDRDALDQFAYKLLWNGSPALTALYSKLSRASAQFLSPRRTGNVYCSLEVAALLLDIAAASHLTRSKDAANAGNAELQRMARLVANLTWTERGDHILIGQGFERRLLDAPADFGLLQGAVWQLEVPLRLDYLEKRAQASDASRNFLAFLERADLLDFPGVPLEDAKQKNQLIDLDAPETDQDKLLKDLLKRGKTNSIVASYARSLGIDEFLILVRAGEYPAKPAQLVHQVEQWWAAADPSFRASDRNSGARRAPLPVKVGMTFFAPIVEACKSGIGVGLAPVFDMLKRLDPLDDPQLVTLFALSYPCFKEGRIDLNKAALAQVAREIRDDAAFKERFPSDVSLKSFDAMIQNAMGPDQDGGVGYLFQQLAGISSAPKMRHVERARQEVRGRLERLMADCLPPLEDGPGPEVHLRAFAKSVKDFILASPDYEEFGRCVEIGRYIRDVSTFRTDDVDPLPINMAEQTRIRDLRDYVGRQFEAWKSRKSRIPLSLPGFENVNARQFVFALGDLIVNESADDLTRWLREELSHVRSIEGARYAREYISLAFSSAILKGARNAARDKDAARLAVTASYEKQLLEFMRQGFKRDRSPRSYNTDLLTVMGLQSPEYRMVVAPFLRRLDQLSSASAIKRRPQIGDDQLKRIYEQHVSAEGSVTAAAVA